MSESAFIRWIQLDDLRRKLRAKKFDALDLKFLQPLRDEVEQELKNWRAS